MIARRSSGIVVVLCAMLFSAGGSSTARADEFTDFAVEAIDLQPAGPGLYDVVVTVSLIPSFDAPSGAPIPLELTDGEGFVLAQDDLLPGGIAGECCDTVATCPPLENFTVNCTNSCVGGGGAGAHTCVYSQSTSFVAVPLVPGTDISATLDPAGLHVETLPGAPANNTLAITVPSLTPAIGFAGQVLAALAIFVTGLTSFWALRARRTA